MQNILSKLLVVLQVIIPAAIFAYFAGLRKGQREKAELQRKYLNETLKEELKKNAEIIEREFGPISPHDAVKKVIGSGGKRDDG